MTDLLSRAAYAHIPRDIWNRLPEPAQDQLSELIDIIQELRAEVERLQTIVDYDEAELHRP